MKQFFKMSAQKDVGRVDIYDEIGFWGTNAATFARQWQEIEASSKRIDVHISSPGGNLFDALTIYNLIQQSEKPVTIYVDGLAASSASLIAMAGKETRMAENALMMLHNPYTVTIGNKAEHESAIQVLEAATKATIVAYARKSGKTDDEIAAILDEETWYGADEAKDAGFVDKVIKAVPMAAKFDANTYGFSVPEAFQDRFATKEPEAPAIEQEAITMSEANKPEAPKPATIQEIEAHCKGCDEAFVLAQLKAQATIPQVQSAWTEVLAKRVADADAKIAALEKEKTDLAAKTPAPGNDPVGDGAAPKAEITGDVLAQWDQLVESKVKPGMPRAKAISAAVKENPELHTAMLAAYNAQHKSA